MAFLINHFNNTSSGRADAPMCYSYSSSTDPITTIDDSAYFDDVFRTLNHGDLIYIVDSNGDSSQRVVSSVTGATPVTTAAFDSSGPILTSTVTVSAANFLAMYATPLVLVAAGGANTMHIVHDVAYEVDYGSAQFAAGGAVGVQYDSTANGAGTAASATVAAATFNGYTADSVVGADGALASAASSTVVNKGLYLSNATAAFTTGDSVVYVHITYSTVSTTV